MRGAGGAAVPSATQATKLNQQVRRPRSPRGFGHHPPPPPSCWALPPLCLMSISIHFKSNLEPQREENLWENSHLSSVDAIESHPGCLFWVPLRKAVRGGLASTLRPAGSRSSSAAGWAHAQGAPVPGLLDKVIAFRHRTGQR